MSLQSRLASLITAVGADIKEHDTRIKQFMAVPQLFLRGGITYPVAAGNSIYWITSEQDVAISPNVDNNRMPVTRDCTPSKYDVVTGYKPQLRLRTVIATNGTDPGTQTYTCGATHVVANPAGGSGGANNRRWTVAGTLLQNARTNLAASSKYDDESGWVDLTDANLTTAGMTGSRLGVYLHATATNAANAFVTCEWEIEMRYVPE